MTTPTPPLDLSEYDRAGIAGTIHECDPAAVERLRALMAEQAAQQPPRWREAARPQYKGSQIVSHLQRAAIARADKVRFVFTDDQLADVDARRAAGVSWESIARDYGVSHTTVWAAYMRQHAAAKKAARQENPQ